MSQLTESQYSPQLTGSTPFMSLLISTCLAPKILKRSYNQIHKTKILRNSNTGNATPHRKDNIYIYIYILLKKKLKKSNSNLGKGRT